MAKNRSTPLPQPTRKRRWRRWLLIALLLPVVLSLLLVLIFRFAAPPLSGVMAQRIIEARQAGVDEFRVDYRWCPFESFGPYLPLAVIASEDQRFLEHHGFDTVEIQKALDDAEDGGRLRGASTISQQVAKNLFLWSGRSYLRKGLEAWYTVLIEFIWPKQRILEVYANIAEFGDGVYGAEAAAQAFFDKPASRLSARESARLAAVLPSPKRYSAKNPGPYVQRRARWIERQVGHLGGPDYLSGPR